MIILRKRAASAPSTTRWSKERERNRSFLVSTFPSRMTGFVMKDAQRMAAILEQIPLHRAGSPEDIAGLALYLCSRAGAYMTGNVIPLDGGILASH